MAKNDFLLLQMLLAKTPTEKKLLRRRHAVTLRLFYDSERLRHKLHGVNRRVTSKVFVSGFSFPGAKAQRELARSAGARAPIF
jgi:hypothetical protein